MTVVTELLFHAIGLNLYQLSLDYCCVGLLQVNAQLAKVALRQWLLALCSVRPDVYFNQCDSANNLIFVHFKKLSHAFEGLLSV